MTHYLGLTWDHPRGRNALRAAAKQFASDDFSIDWDVHSLEGFESASIEELAQKYDLIVLDHPHLGDALATDSLYAVDELFDAEELAAWASNSVGPSLISYQREGHQWALPLDAATQVSARRADLILDAPELWSDVQLLCRTRPVALSLAGPHALLTFASMSVAFGEEPSVLASDTFVSADTAARVLSVMTDVTELAPLGTEALNPIAMLERMSTTNSLAYVPLIYGYVNYSNPALAAPVTFGDAPAVTSAARIGSTIGGTGIAISRRATITTELLEHVRWLLSPEVQASFIPEHDGQPSATSAWTDEAVNAASSNFYAGTLKTIEQSWVRPRFANYISFQTDASAVIRSVLAGSLEPARGIEQIDSLYRTASAPVRAKEGQSA